MSMAKKSVRVCVSLYECAWYVLEWVWKGNAWETFLVGGPGGGDPGMGTLPDGMSKWTCLYKIQSKTRVQKNVLFR